MWEAPLGLYHIRLPVVRTLGASTDAVGVVASSTRSSARMEDEQEQPSFSAEERGQADDAAACAPPWQQKSRREAFDAGYMR